MDFKNLDWWHFAVIVWVTMNLVECSFTANPQTGISVGVQTRPSDSKQEIKTEDGPQADWK
jgi:hypothetical protein